MTETEAAPIDDAVPSRLRLIPAVVAGTYSWALTVLPSAASMGATSVAALAAGAAILVLLVSPLLPPGRAGLIAALDVFLGFSILSWWAGRSHGVAPPFAVFGSFGWLAYTLALGALSTPTEPRERPDPGPRLDPRTPPSRLSTVALAICVLSCLALLGAAWKIERPALSVLAHVFALTMVLLVLKSGAHFSTYLQVRNTKLATTLSLRAAMWPLIALGLLLLAAGFWMTRA